MKKIEDYLFHYIGCPIMICEPGIRPVFHHELEGYDYSLKKAIAERVNYDPTWIKPILRRLSDMTNQELIELVRIFSEKDSQNIIIEWTPERNFVVATYNTCYPEDYQKEEFDKLTMSICIDDEFQLYNHWNYYRGNGIGVSNEKLSNSHEMTRYLISKGFDIFGLIDDNLAIEKQS